MCIRDRNLLPKPFYQFILDAAYQNVGTNHIDVLTIAFARVDNILALKVVGGRERQEFRNRVTDIYKFRKKPNSSDEDAFIFT